MFYGRERDVPETHQRLAEILEILSRVEGVREELVADIRTKIEREEYLTEAKLNEAIHRLLRAIMADEERVA